MLNGSYDFCCRICFKNLAKKSTKAAKFWLDLCDGEKPYAGEEGVIVFNEMASQIHQDKLRILENENLIVSTENSTETFVKLMFFEDSDKEVIFCGLPKAHLNDSEK